MISNDMTIFRIAIAVALNCAMSDQPKSGITDSDSAAEYIGKVLDIVFANSVRTYTVRPLPYPHSSKIPLVIALDGVDQCLFWYYPHADQGCLALQLEDVLHGIGCNEIRVPA